MTLKIKKEALKKSLASAKETLDAISLKQKQVAEKKNKQSKEIEKQMKTNFMNNAKGAITMNKTQIKSDLAVIKMLAKVTGQSVEKMAEQYFVEKAMEGTAEHSGILNEVKSSDMILSFNSKDKELNLINSFTKVDMNGKAKMTIFADAENFSVKHVAEKAPLPELTWDETPIVLETSRSGLSFSVTRELQTKSIIDQIQYLNSKVSLAIGRGMLEGIINGQAAATYLDVGYVAGEMGQKGPGIRAALAAASKTKSFSASAVSADNMIEFLEAAGDLFAQRQERFVLLCALRDHSALSKVVRKSKTSGSAVNDESPVVSNAINLDSSFVSETSKVYIDRFMDVPVIRTGFLKSPVASGSGYDATGFVGSTAANNDHSSLLLIDPSKVYYSIDDVQLVSKDDPSTNSIQIYLNLQAGWTFHTAELGLMGIDVGADIA